MNDFYDIGFESDEEEVYESEDDENIDAEKEKEDGSEKKQKKNKKCQYASPAECNSEAKNPKLSGLPRKINHQ